MYYSSLLKSLAKILRGEIRSNVIRKEDYVTKYRYDFPFEEHIDKKATGKIIENIFKNAGLDYFNPLCMDLIWFLTRDDKRRNVDPSYITEAMYHCDTQEEENSWRVQLKIQIRIYPEVVSLLLNENKKGYQISYEPYNNMVVLTFNLPKI